MLRFYSIVSILAISSISAYSQASQTGNTIMDIITAPVASLINGSMACQPDSAHAYRINSPVDSVLDSRSLAFYDGNTRTSHTYAVPSGEKIGYDSIISDQMGRTIFEEIWEWDEDSMALFKEEGTINYFNSTHHQLDSSIHFARHFSTGLFAPESKVVHLYTGMDNLLSSTINYSWNGNTMTWDFSNMENFHYTGSTLDSSTTFYWNGGDTIADLKSYYSYYPNDSLQSKTSYDIMSGDPFEKEEHFYNEMTNEKVSLGYAWETDSLDWLLVTTIVQGRDESDRLVSFSILADFFGFVFGIRSDITYLGETSCPSKFDLFDALKLDSVLWIHAERVHFYPKEQVSNVKVSKDFEPSVFPNPNSGQFYIETDKPALIEGYDLLGRSVFRHESNGKQLVDVPGSFNGWMNLRITIDGHSVLKKVLVLD